MRILKTAIILTVLSILPAACAQNPDAGEGPTANNKKPAGKAATPKPQQPTTPSSAMIPQPGTNSGLGQTQTGSSPAGENAGAGGVASADEGSHLFTEMGCNACHGQNGKGVIRGAPDFTNKSWDATQTDDQMISTIRKGHSPMPPYSGRLTDAQIKSLVAYVRTFAR